MDAVTPDTAGDVPIDYRDIRTLRSAAHAKSQRRRTLNHRVRFAAKQYHQDHPTEAPCKTYGISCRWKPQNANPTDAELSTQQQPSVLRSHAERELRAEERERQSSTVKGLNHRKPRSKVAWNLQQDDDVALARSRVSLPSDRSRTLQRHPSLEREDAFCDATTYKGKVHVKRMPDVAMNDDAQIAELYRMGLLYDGEEKQQNTDAGFNLNNIHHDEPIFTIRPARRGRKAHRAGGYDGKLPLDLSFSDLGNDYDLNQYFNASPDEMDTTGDDTLQHRSRRTSSHSSAPLRVIYELATSRPSFDFDTSQPPDLMNDSLSDYDCFSDSELDDNNGLPSQREVHDAAAATSASGPWVLLGDDS